MFEIWSIHWGGKYWRCRTRPRHPKCLKNQTCYLHRVVMENHLGRLLTTNEQVHHIDENVHNNDLGNLKVMSPKEHRSHHRAKFPKLYITDYCTCGNPVTLIDHQWRSRTKGSNSGKVFCSRGCSAKHSMAVRTRTATGTWSN